MQVIESRNFWLSKKWCKPGAVAKPGRLRYGFRPSKQEEVLGSMVTMDLLFVPVKTLI
jgi:hypothetical protein